MSTLYDIRSGTLVKSTLYTNGLLLKNVLFFDPLSLFTGGNQGVWYDPSDMSSLFQDVAETVPVTKDGDPVALMRDKSGNGNHATQTVSTSRPIYKTDGVLHWLNFDGIDDQLLFNKNTFLADKSQVIMTAYSLLSAGNYPVVISSIDGAEGVEVAHFEDTLRRRLAVPTNAGYLTNNSVGSLSLNTPILRTSYWNRSTGAAVDKANRADAFITSPSSENALLILPSKNYSIGRVSTVATNMDFYGVVAISDDLSPTAIADVELYLTTKSGVTL